MHLRNLAKNDIFDEYIMLKIRLTQTGARNSKQYRIIAIDKSKRRDGQAIEILGFYNPTVKPAIVKVNRERIDYWVGKGGQITDGLKKILK
jgi:small subunit ribosomal protein S16